MDETNVPREHRNLTPSLWRPFLSCLKPVNWTHVAASEGQRAATGNAFGMSDASPGPRLT